MPLCRQALVGRNSSAAAELAFARAHGAPEIRPAHFACLALPLVHLAAAGAAWALQPGPLPAAVRVVGRLLVTVLGGVPPLKDVRIVGQCDLFCSGASCNLGLALRSPMQA